jgi:CelD/BcsL family acetyltransferase involved in cellulose biosynthesis
MVMIRNSRFSVAFRLEPVPPLNELADLWSSLDMRGDHSFFVSWSWVGTLLRCIPAQHSLRLLRATEGAGTVGMALIGLNRRQLAGVLRARQGWFNALGDPALDCITVEHNGFATDGSSCGRLLENFLTAFQSDFPEMDELMLPGVKPQANPCNGLILRERSAKGYKVPLDALGPDGNIESLLSKNSRYRLSRTRRWHQRRGEISLTAADSTETALRFFEDLKAYHVMSWERRGKRHAFTEPFFELFHRSLIVEAFPKGSIDLLRINVGDRTVGYLYNFRHRDVVYSYQSGFDDTVGESRPGYLCHALAIAKYHAEGLRYYDFLAGTNRLKESYGIQQYDLRWQQVQKPTAAFKVEGFARRVFRG